MIRDLALVSQAAAIPELNDAPLGDTATVETPSRAAPTRSETPRPRRATQTPAGSARSRSTAAAPAQPVRRDPPPAAGREAEPTVVESAASAGTRARGFQSGTSFALTTRAPICTTNLPGDKITATLAEPVSGDNGAYMPAGTVVVLEVASVSPGDSPESAQLGLRVRSILLDDQSVTMQGDVAIVSELERREVPRNKNADRRKVVTGAVAGAILGQIMGKDTRSTVIGAAAGAAAGTAAAVASRKFDACLPAGGTVRVTTSQPITLAA